MPKISIIAPFYNEEENVPLFMDRLLPVINSLSHTCEVVLINDGSTDRTSALLHKAAAEDARVRVIDFVRNYGQTAALQAGFDHSTGEIIVTMDSDLQNDPADIPALLAKLDEGYDVVSGWRKERQDAGRRVLPSKIANRLISRISGVRLHDYGCTLKAYRRGVMRGMRLYGEMHRFIPIYASWQGARIAEIPVRHHARVHGASKYGFNRIAKVLLDLCLLQFLERYLTRPIYVFGSTSILFLLMSGVAFLWALGLKLFFGVSFVQTPLPLVSVMTFCLSILSLLLGLLAEVLSRTYFESQSLSSYQIRREKERDTPE